jgi:hypothetical protein
MEFDQLLIGDVRMYGDTQCFPESTPLNGIVPEANRALPSENQSLHCFDVSLAWQIRARRQNNEQYISHVFVLGSQ